MAKKFTMIDESFTCNVCHRKVEKLGKSARDHCPYCLSSNHVDIYPGDRACKCHGILEPVAIDSAKKGNLKIVYCCRKCKTIKRNIAASDDNFDLILDIMSQANDIHGK